MIETINSIIEKELKEIPLIIGIEDLSEEKYKRVIKILEKNKISYEITLLTKENPRRIIKGSLKKVNKDLVKELKEVLRE